MRYGYRMVVSLAVGAILAAGCATGHGYHHDWNSGETVYYTQWEAETHRDHKDYNNRPADEQKQYWSWRDSHQN
jgi:hypothetical protein